MCDSEFAWSNDLATQTGTFNKQQFYFLLHRYSEPFSYSDETRLTTRYRRYIVPIRVEYRLNRWGTSIKQQVMNNLLVPADKYNVNVPFYLIYD